MRAIVSIQRQFEADLQDVHVARVRLVLAVAFTALRCGRISLTALGRAIAVRTTQKHGIKRVDRLLGNVKLHDQRVVFYRAIAHRLIRRGSRPLVVVDWTSVTPTLWALVAAVCFEGRALVIYAETHPIEQYMKPHVNLAFLHQLESVLPNGCSPIIVTDAGFRSPWMKLVECFNWDFIGRLRAPAKIRRAYGEAFAHIEDFWHLARSVPADLGTFQIGHKRRYPVRVVAVRRKRRVVPIPLRRDCGSERHRREAHEPWMLATSLDWPARKVAAAYRLRMQIEETFRDAKSNRYGLSLGQARTRSQSRANILLLLLAFAHLFLVLVGAAAELAQVHFGYQANTVRDRRVLSFATLGRLVLERERNGVARTKLAAVTWSAVLLRTCDALTW